MPALLRCLLVILFCAIGQLCVAQDSVSRATLICKPRLLKGKWQLSKTYSMGAYHNVAKEDYNSVIDFKGHHQFTEEVIYESSHWIIEGKWSLNRKSGELMLTRRQYALGKLEDHPQDIILHIIQLTTQSWGGKGVVKAQPVELYYVRIQKFQR